MAMQEVGGLVVPSGWTAFVFNGQLYQRQANGTWRCERWPASRRVRDSPRRMLTPR